MNKHLQENKETRPHRTPEVLTPLHRPVLKLKKHIIDWIMVTVNQTWGLCSISWR